MKKQELTTKQRVLWLQYQSGMCSVAGLISLSMALMCVFANAFAFGFLNLFIGAFNFLVSNRLEAQAKKLNEQANSSQN